MKSRSDMLRVICVQGTIQLAVAINALLLRENSLKTRDHKFVNILIVYGLFVPKNQEPLFFSVIQKMASSLLIWERIIYLDSDIISRLNRIITEKGLFDFKKQFKAIIGVDECDEIYLGREWQLGNLLMMTYFSDAYKICYGDGIGLYFGETYFSGNGKVSRLGKLVKSVKERLALAYRHPQRKPLFKKYTRKTFDYGYLVFPNISGDLPSFKYERVPTDFLKRTIDAFSNHFSFEILSAVNWMDSNVSILLTTNFSEANRTSLDNELRLYNDFLGSGKSCEKNLLVIKPHPRDDRTKIELIKESFISLGYNVFLLDDLNSFFTPFECFLIKIEKLYPELFKRINIFCTSSSCLSIQLLFGIDPKIGFGDELIMKYFKQEQIYNRIQHERDLKKLMAYDT